MKLFIILSSICALALGRVIPSLDDEIIGGVVTTIEEHPYQISLRYRGRHNCGGSIINQDTILTAAHCVHGFNYDLITVRVGATEHSEGEEFEVARIIKHPEYFVGAPYNNDVAVMKLARPLTYSAKVQPIALQPAGSPVPAGTAAVISGWGTTVAGVHITPDELREVEVDVITHARCEASYEDTSMTITETMLCAQTSDKNSCQGDPGGPIVAGDKLIGVSWGFECAAPAYPGIYTDVSALHSFIDKYL